MCVCVSDWGQVKSPDWSLCHTLGAHPLSVFILDGLCVLCLGVCMCLVI